MAYYTPDEAAFEEFFRTTAHTVSYCDANGIEHESYEAACHYYGADTPAMIALEEAYWAEIEAEEELALRINEALVVPFWPEPECPF